MFTLDRLSQERVGLDRIRRKKDKHDVGIDPKGLTYTKKQKKKKKQSRMAS